VVVCWRRAELDALELDALDLAGGRGGRPRAGGGGRRARHQRPARAEVLAVVAELAAVAMRVVLRWSRTWWSPSWWRCFRSSGRRLSSAGRRRVT
jgi:hypothetical protein